LAEQEQELLQKMQTISQLLGQVDAALAEEGSTQPPPTAASQRPPPTASSRPPPTAASSRPPPTASQPPPTADYLAEQRRKLDSLQEQLAVRLRTGERPSTGQSGRAASCDPPQIAVIHENQPPKVQLVSYTGTQSALGGIQTRRRASAETTAARSEMGSLLHWAAAPPLQAERRPPGPVRSGRGR